MELARAWFEAESDGMRAHGDALVRRAEVENVDDISFMELARILDAVEIVRHDCLPIVVKLHCAIDGRDEAKPRCGPTIPFRMTITDRRSWLSRASTDPKAPGEPSTSGIRLAAARGCSQINWLRCAPQLSDSSRGRARS